MIQQNAVLFRGAAIHKLGNKENLGNKREDRGIRGGGGTAINRDVGIVAELICGPVERGARTCVRGRPATEGN